MDRYVFAVIVDGLDSSDDRVVDAVDAHPELVLLTDVDGVITLHVEIEGASSESAIRAAAHLIESELRGVSVRQIDLDLVAATDIAERVGVSRQAVTNWATGKRNGDAFPPPIGHVAGGTRIWPWSVVLPWLVASGHASGDERTLSYSSIVDANALLQQPRRRGRLPSVAGSGRSMVRTAS